MFIPTSLGFMEKSDKWTWLSNCYLHIFFSTIVKIFK